MSYSLQPRSAISPQSKAISPTSNMNSLLKYQSEVSAALSKNTNLVEQEITRLTIPPSPASFRPLNGGSSIEERLFDAVAAAKMLTAQVAMHLKREWRSKLFKQIDSLHDLAEWESDDIPLGQSSFATFLKAIIQINPQRPPGLGLSHEGNLIAAWTVAQDRLTIEFFRNDRLSWVLTRYSDGEPERAAGQTAVSRLLECLMPYQPNNWFSYDQSKEGSTAT